MPDLLLAKLIVIMTLIQIGVLQFGIPKWLKRLGFTPAYYKPLDELTRPTRVKLQIIFALCGVLGLAANLVVWGLLNENSYGFFIQLVVTLPTWILPLLLFSRRAVYANQ